MDFQTLYHQALEQFNICKKKANVCAFLRFVTMLFCIGGLLYGYYQQRSFFYYISGCCLLAFMILVTIHQKIKKRCLYYQHLVSVYKTHIDRQNNEWSCFEDTGHEFIEEHEMLSHDLDLFGHHSLFQMMNICKSYKGRCQFARSLTEGIAYDKIKQRQEAIQELSLHPDLMIRFEVFTYNISHQFDGKCPHVGCRPIPIFCLLIGPSLILLSLILMLFHHVFGRILFEVVFVFQLILSFIMQGKHQQMFEPLLKSEKSLNAFQEGFECLHEMNFQSDALKDLYHSLFVQHQALEGMKGLSQLATLVRQRFNLFAMIFLNGLFGYDFLVQELYRRWFQQYGCYVEQWLEDFAEVEVLMSLAIPFIDGFDVCLPSFASCDNLELSFTNLRHPLICQDHVVGNDFHLQHQTNVITGSNMSGKTTFMRTVALNLVLAQAGGYVFADTLECSYMHILTSMRVRDNVEEGISTFYGELLRIKDMITYSRTKQPMICFIDEIFKGTNSLDRIAGAKATLEKLSLPYCMVFITTHDFELTKMDHVLYSNYHFEEYYVDGQLRFDYQIKKGPSTSTNGKFLLQQVGIL